MKRTKRAVKKRASSKRRRSKSRLYKPLTRLTSSRVTGGWHRPMPEQLQVALTTTYQFNVAVDAKKVGGFAVDAINPRSSHPTVAHRILPAYWSELAQVYSSNRVMKSDVHLQMALLDASSSTQSTNAMNVTGCWLNKNEWKFATKDFDFFDTVRSKTESSNGYVGPPMGASDALRWRFTLDVRKRDAHMHDRLFSTITYRDTTGKWQVQYPNADTAESPYLVVMFTPTLPSGGTMQVTVRHVQHYLFNDLHAPRTQKLIGGTPFGEGGDNIIPSVSVRDDMLIEPVGVNKNLDEF